MATLSKADRDNLSSDQQAAVLAEKEKWNTANTAYQAALKTGVQADIDAAKNAMDTAHNAAEKIRENAASGVSYSGGAAGNAYKDPVQSNANKISAYTDAYATNNYASGGTNPYMKADPANGYANLSQADSALLNAEQQKQIAALKAAYAAAATQEEKNDIHALAEEIRKAAGYTGGTTGADYAKLAAGAGGMTADDMQKWLEDYMYTNYKTGRGWTNGYSTAMNVRSKANQIRQQMLANEQAMANVDQDTRNYLHQQNLDLARLLHEYAGGVESTYNEEKGRWETTNPDVGYGYNLSADDPGYINMVKKYSGYTDEDIQRFANDTSYYYNFVDPRLNRLAIDESSGYTGIYSQFVNGPYAQLLGGGTHDGSVNPSVYQSMTGDGFAEGEFLGFGFTPIRDENGNVINAKAPQLKNNNAMSDYTNQFTSYVQGGVIQPGILAASHPGGGSSHGGVQKGTDNGMYSHKTKDYVDGSDPRYTGGVNRDVAASTADDPNNSKGQTDYYLNYGQYATSPSVGGGSASGGGYESYLEQMYAAALQAQLDQLKSSYDQNISELDASKGTVDDTYTEQKRQTTGTNAQNAAAWREMANAYGLNSGTIGQAALAQNNQLQSNLNTLESAQAAAQAEIERQRTLLGQQYQLAINQAMSENNFNKAQALYQEAVRQDELLVQQQQFQANLALQYAQLAQQQSQFDAEMALNYAKAAGSGSSGSSGGSGGVTVSNNRLYTKLYEAANESPNPQNYIATNYKDYGFDSSTGLWGGYQDWATELETNKGTADIISRLNNTTYQSTDNATASALTAQLKNDTSLTNEQKLNVAQMAYQNGHISSRQLTQMLDSLGL